MTRAKSLALLGIPAAGALGGGGASYLLDTYPALAAFDSVRLTAAYGGATDPVLLLRRDSDDAEQAFYFDSDGLLNTAAIATWGGGSNLYCKTMYDLTGNGYHATQTDTALQPLYVAEGHNGRPTLQFTTTRDDRLIVSSLPIGAFSIFSTWKSVTTSALIYEHSADTTWSSGTNLYTTIGITINTRRGSLYSRKDATASWGAGNVMRICSHLYGGTHATHKLYANGTEIALTDGNRTDNPGTEIITDDFYIGGRGVAGVLSLNGQIGSMIIFNTDQAANRTAIEAGINSVWGAY